MNTLPIWLLILLFDSFGNFPLIPSTFIGVIAFATRPQDRAAVVGIVFHGRLVLSQATLVGSFLSELIGVVMIVGGWVVLASGVDIVAGVVG